MSISYSPLDYADLTEQTYSVLMDRILRRQLEPGERISVEEVARGLGVSRTPVTDALKKLANDGLVEIIPRRGSFVTELNARDVGEFFDIRLMIELYAAECILQNGKVHQLLENIKEPMTGMQQAMVEDDYGDYEAFIARDRDLHMALVNLTENQHLIRMYSGLNVHMRVARAHYLNTVENARQVQREHEAIARAFQEGNRESVKQALRKHIGNVKARILEILQERGGRL
jgi:DNA-binding GntR family transcriptional regulator